MSAKNNTHTKKQDFLFALLAHDELSLTSQDADSYAHFKCLLINALHCYYAPSNPSSKILRHCSTNAAACYHLAAAPPGLVN